VKCIIAPLIFASIVAGISSAGSVAGLGKTGLRAIAYFEVATTLALAVGLWFVNWFKPGEGVRLSGAVSEALAKTGNSSISFGGFIEHLLPVNFAEAIVKGDVLQIVIFSSLFGVAVLLAGERGKPVLAFCEGLNEVMFKFTGIIMMLAPIGVGAAAAMSVAEHGIGVVVPLLKLVGTLYLALLVFVAMVLLPALLYARVNIGRFFREIRPALVLAFATTSSESAYPQALASLEKMGVKKRISSFVLPLGYSFNLDGSTLYLALASVFVAQAAEIELTVWTQISMMLTLMLTTKGVAAVPRASLVVLSGTLTAFGLPLEGITLILGVDEFMDMARTSVNLLGNCVATLVVSRWEGERLAPEFERGAVVSGGLAGVDQGL
jgi:proton glutamate symport protein